MKKYLLILLLAAGCTHKLEKPFVIVNKFRYFNRGYSTYFYQDKNGYEYNFEDALDKYNVGDTIH